MNVKDKSDVGKMFDNIAKRYDFLNHFLTLNIDKTWRKKAVKQLQTKEQAIYLDIASGTGDLAIAIAKRKNPKQVIGIDISEGMLEIGREKVKRLGLDSIISLQLDNSESLPFNNNLFDAATIGFGIRNFENSSKGLDEIYRILKPDGELVILEFSRPQNTIIRWIYDIYFRHVLPFIGKLLSKHSSAYNYLPESVIHFPYGQEFVNMMDKSGFKDITYQSLTFGIAMIYRGIKRQNRN